MWNLSVYAADDCFEIGRVAWNGWSISHALDWIQEGLRRETPADSIEQTVLQHLIKMISGFNEVSLKEQFIFLPN